MDIEEAESNYAELREYAPGSGYESLTSGRLERSERRSVAAKHMSGVGVGLLAFGALTGIFTIVTRSEIGESTRPSAQFWGSALSLLPLVAIGWMGGLWFRASRALHRIDKDPGDLASITFPKPPHDD
jgi:hypothetical protein